jgi:hypothetical protein
MSLSYCVLMLLGSLRHWRLRWEERRNVRRVMSELALGLAAVVIVILLVSRRLWNWVTSGTHKAAPSDQLASSKSCTMS